MKLMSTQSKWAGHLGYQLAAAEVDERFATKHLDRLTALAQIRNKGGSVSAMKAGAYDDEDVAKALDEQQGAFAYRKLVEALYNAIDKDAFTASRELTRRIGRNDRDRRSGRYGD